MVNFPFFSYNSPFICWPSFLIGILYAFKSWSWVKWKMVKWQIFHFSCEIHKKFFGSFTIGKFYLFLNLVCNLVLYFWKNSGLYCIVLRCTMYNVHLSRTRWTSWCTDLSVDLKYDGKWVWVIKVTQEEVIVSGRSYYVYSRSQ